MGATRWQTIRRVVLPNSISGILTGVILEVSRTAGETAPIMFTGAAMFVAFLPEGVLDQTMALSLHLYTISTQQTGVPEELTFGVGPRPDRDRAAHERGLDRLQGVSAGAEEVVDASVPVGRPSGGTSPLYDDPPIIEVRGLSISYGGKPALQDRHARHPPPRDLRDHRTGEQRQDLVPARAQTACPNSTPE